MQRYSPTISEHFLNPRNVGGLEGPSFTGRAGSMTCGATVRISLRIDEAQRISETKFKAAGCVVLIAAASFLTAEIKGELTSEVAVLVREQPEVVLKALGEIPQDRLHCVALVREALLAAITSYSDSARQHWEGDEALICTCFCVSERTIEELIAAGEMRTVAEVTKACNAGGGCRSCHSLIEDILSSKS